MPQQFPALFQPLQIRHKTLRNRIVFGAARTLETVETAFYRPLVSTTQNHGAWVEAGAKTAAERATSVWQEALSTYTEPPIDAAIRDELSAFVARRREQGGAAID